MNKAGAVSRAWKDRRETVSIWAPTTSSNEPVASSRMIAEPPSSKRRLKLVSWRLQAVVLSFDQVAGLLTRSADADSALIQPGLLMGEDLRYWVQIMRLAGSIVVRHEYLPTLREEGTEYHARWEPVLTGSDAEKLSSIVKQAPGVARALSKSETDSAPRSDPNKQARAFLDQFVDYCVRTAAVEAPPFHRRQGKQKNVSLHDQWLEALCSKESRLRGKTAELRKLAEQVVEWRHPVDITTASPFRLGFRLEEPEPEELTQTARSKIARPKANRSPWTLRFLLQSVEDPSLMVSADEAWNGSKALTQALRSSPSQPAEFLLSALGQAAGLCPHIEKGLRRKRPESVDLTTEDAHSFLANYADTLQQAGFGVWLPSWWTGRGSQQRLHARPQVKSPKMQSSAGLSLDTIVRFQWQVALGDTPLTQEELKTLASLKQSLVQIRGQWVEINPDEIQRALKQWNKKGSQQAPLRDVIQMGLGNESETNGIPVGGLDADGWIRTLLERLRGETEWEELPAPAGLQGALRPYQRRGFSWLAFLRQWGLGACLADDMGLGKTVQTLALIQRDWEKDDHRPVLLICPTSVINNWKREAEHFTPSLPIMVHHGAGRSNAKRFQQEAEKVGLVISSYALLQRDRRLFEPIDWKGIILDEAQNIKNPETKQSQAARGLGGDYRVALTGTPIENNVGDLWAIMDFLNPGFLGKQAEFKRRFFLPIQVHGNNEASEQLRRLTQPFILRRRKTDREIAPDLPEKQETKVYSRLTKEQASLYQAVLKETEESLEDSEGIQRKGLVLATLSKLKQICNHPAQFLKDGSKVEGRSGKMARLTELLDELIRSGDKAIIFTQFSEMGEILQRHCREMFGRETFFLHGGTSKKRRDRMIEEFQSDTGPPIFVLSIKAGGTGLNLTAASHVFHFDRWWNPAVEDQATDRAFRIGQTKNVEVHKFCCTGTLEERIDDMIEQKKAIAERVVGTGEDWLTKLSNEELKELFALREEAIEK